MNVLHLNMSGGLIELISQPWHWSVSGVAIASILFLLTWMGRTFGVSTTFKSMCQVAGVGKNFDYFKNFDFNHESWRLVFILGAITGGFISVKFLQSPDAIDISASTLAHLKEWGWDYPQGRGFLPTEIFNFSNPKGIILTIIGGFLIGFGTRYGDGCTSGHAITGLAHLQLPSLIAVVGFFIGGLIMTWGILPLIFG